MKIPEGLSCSVTPEQAYYPFPIPHLHESLASEWEIVRLGWCQASGDCVLWDSVSTPHPPEEGTGHHQGAPRIIVRKKPAPAPPVRFIVEFTGKDTQGEQGGTLYDDRFGCRMPVRAVREVKPITREQIKEAVRDIWSTNPIPDAATVARHVMAYLRIEVEE